MPIFEEYKKNKIYKKINKNIHDGIDKISQYSEINYPLKDGIISKIDNLCEQQNIEKMGEIFYYKLQNFFENKLLYFNF